MRRIDKLLFLAVAPPFILTFVILTFIVSIRQFGTFSELLITRNASLGVMLAIAGAILPDILIYSLPLSFLIGVLIGLGGLSGENQILALRAGGFPLRSLLRFVLFLGTAVGIFTAILSLVVAPRANDFRRQIVDRVSVSLATSHIQAHVFNEDFPSMVFYIKDMSEDKQHLSQIFLADHSRPENHMIVLARSATWVRDPDNRRIQIHLDHGASYSTSIEAPEKDNQSFFKSTDIPIEIKKNTPVSSGEKRTKKPGEFKTLDLWENAFGNAPDAQSTKTEQADRLKQIVELNRRTALPLSIIPFSLLGIALAVGAPKSGRAFGFGMGLITVIIFYMLFANGIRLASVGKISPWLGPWVADILLTLAGCFLFALTEKRFALNHWTTTTSWRKSRKPYQEKTGSRYESFLLKALGRLIRLMSPKILDFYILRGVLTYFLWSLIACTTLFLLLTVFELLDDVVRNSIPLISLADYMVFFTPQILVMAIPMSFLLAVLINLGILEKDSEITAIKAGGGSLYRLAFPIFLLSALFSSGIFLIQEYILPYANDRQDNLRNYIQNKSALTSKRMQRKWILGNAERIYNYEYFDGGLNSFINLNVYEIDFSNSRLLRRIHAERARIGEDGVWTLENGWLRNYMPDSFEWIQLQSIRLPEQAGYFKREIFQPKESSKFTYKELRRYILYLKKSGYNAVELQVELHKKIAFPVSCLIMAFLGIHFGFSVGKKGAFFGIGISVAIALSYWGVSGMFEAMGSYGILLPVLAAWAPNILFGAAGLALFLTIKT